MGAVDGKRSHIQKDSRAFAESRSGFHLSALDAARLTYAAEPLNLI
ncbi:MAG: hypothetical protein HY785_02570 [Oscillatoriophycideae cyanobacterium NC_groundwater_1537_Pr4_S-0.65um_50_18]|nr:hypothetical protein [Oscillatoriophycideae cyanobacterium NC_groundwater_1537_Pr4_S-0.65um_50_18]